MFQFIKIELENFGYWYDDVIDNSSTDAGVDIISSSLQIQLQTVGESTWNTIQEALIDTELTVHSFDLPNRFPNEGERKFPSLKFNRYFNKNDKIRLRLKNVFKHNGGSSAGFKLYLFGSSNIEAKDDAGFDGIYNIKFNPEFVEYGQTYDIKNVINKNYKQLDFIKGVAHAFNLQFTTDEFSKKIHIEPFNSFYKSLYEAIDWTYKVDKSQEIKEFGLFRIQVGNSAIGICKPSIFKRNLHKIKKKLRIVIAFLSLLIGSRYN